MIKKSILIALTVFIGPVSKAEAVDRTVIRCVEQVQEVAKVLGVNFEASSSDRIGRCVENLVRINDPKAHVLQFEKENKCGFTCRSKWKILKKTYYANDYYDLIKDRVDQEELDLVEAVTGVSIKEMVEGEYYDVETHNEKRNDNLEQISKSEGLQGSDDYPIKSFGLPLLKDIIFEYSKLNFRVQRKILNIDEIEDVDERILFLENEIKTCLDVVTTEKGLSICIEKIEENAVYYLGEFSLEANLNNHFQDKIQSELYNDFKSKASEYYDSCVVNYYFNTEIVIEKKSDKIQPCVFNSLLKSFSSLAQNIVLDNSKIPHDEAEKIVIDSIDQCGDKRMMSMHEDKRISTLQSFSIDEFTDYILNCQKTFTSSVVLKIGTESIAGHPSIIDILGSVEAQKFAANLVMEEIPKCIERAGGDFGPEQCTNYLFAKTSSRIFPIVIQEEFTKTSQELSFIDSELISFAISDAEESLRICEGEMLDDFGEFLSLSENEAEVKVATCLRAGIVGSLGRVINKFISTELQSNEMLKENKIEFGPHRKEKLKSDFLSCAEENINIDNGLESVVETSATFLDDCTLDLTKQIILETFETIVSDDLFEIGLNREQVSSVYKTYLQQPDNLLVLVSSAKSMEEVELVLQDIDKQIVKSIASDVIRYLIVNKSPLELNQRVLDELVRVGASDLNSCLESEEMVVCSARVEKILMVKAVESFLPEQAYAGLESSLSKVLSAKEIRSYGFVDKIKSDLETSAEGKELLEHIATEISSGVSVDDIKTDRKVLKYVVRVAIEPVAADILKKLIVKKSPIKFNRSNMDKLISEGKVELLRCLSDDENIDSCSDKTERVILQKAVVLYLPSAVNRELQESLSTWFTKSEISSYGLIAKFTQSLTTGKVGTGVLRYIANELGKGVSAERIKNRSRVTSYVYLVLSSYRAPGGSGRMIIDDIEHRIIQKEINKFVVELNQGKHNGFLTIGVHVLFAGRKAKTAFDWSNSKRTSSGVRASNKFKEIFKRVVEGGAAISETDLENIKQLVKDAILEYRRYVINKK